MKVDFVVQSGIPTRLIERLGAAFRFSSWIILGHCGNSFPGNMWAALEMGYE
jgi:hypothetical protein